MSACVRQLWPNGTQRAAMRIAQAMRSAACLGVVAWCADERSARMTSRGGSVNKASRTRGSRRAADRSRRRSVTGRARSLRSRFVPHLDQGRSMELSEQGQKIAFEAIRRDVIRSEEALAQRSDGYGLREEGPHAGAGRVEGVVGPRPEVEDGGLSA